MTVHRIAPWQRAGLKARKRDAEKDAEVGMILASLFRESLEMSGLRPHIYAGFVVGALEAAGYEVTRAGDYRGWLATGVREAKQREAP